MKKNPYTRLRLDCRGSVCRVVARLARGGYADVSGRLAKVTAGEFETAWLCNLDLMDENASAKLKISSIKVNAGNVEVAP